MNEKGNAGSPMSGGSALLVIFAVLCLTVFALLTLSTALADSRLNEASVRAVSAYYDADLWAEEIFSELRSGQNPECVTKTGDVYSYSCPITETQFLQVRVEKKDDIWTVLQWQAISAVEYQESVWNVWDGE